MPAAFATGTSSVVTMLSVPASHMKRASSYGGMLMVSSLTFARIRITPEEMMFVPEISPMVVPVIPVTAEMSSPS